MGKVNFLQALIAPEYWEALEEIDALALNGMTIVKTPLLGLANDL